jgi:hypothetical protein
MTKRTSFEEFMEDDFQVSIENPSDNFKVWADQFNTSIEQIARIVYYGGFLTFQGVEYEYDSELKNIVESIDSLNVVCSNRETPSFENNYNML